MDSEMLDDAGCRHEDAALLPWLLTGRLSRVDAERVERHLQGCAECRADLEQQRWLRDTMRADETVQYAPQGGFQKLLARIDAMDRELPSAAAEVAAAGPAAVVAEPARVGRVPRWLAAAMVVQTLGLGIVGTALWRGAGPPLAEPGYRTLTSAPASRPAGPQVRIVPSAGMTLAQFNALLAEVGATVVDGPTRAGAYTLAVPVDSAPDLGPTTALERLRTHPGILLAEPVAAGGP